MSKGIETTLKLEIECYLDACGFTETLEVFRKEYNVKFGTSSGEQASVGTKQSSLGKRYFENMSKVLQTGKKVDSARQKIATSEKKLDRLRAEMVKMEEKRFKNILLNLELVSAIKAKMQDPDVVNPENTSDVGLELENVLNMSEKRHSYSCDSKCHSGESEQESLVSLKPPESLSSTVNSGASCQTSTDSVFQIIPDDELRNISPLVSEISLESWGYKRNQMTKDSDYNSSCDFSRVFGNSTFGCSGMQAKYYDVASIGTPSSAALSSLKEEIDCRATSPHSKCRKNKPDEHPGKTNLPRWCEKFLKIPNTSNLNRPFSKSEPKSYYGESNSTSSFVSSTIDDFLPSCTDLTLTESSLGTTESYSSVAQQDLDFLSKCCNPKHGDFSKPKAAALKPLNSTLKLFNGVSTLESPFEEDISKNHRAAEKLFSDTHLLKTENKMDDKGDYKMMLDLKTPFMKNKAETRKPSCYISSNNHKQGPNYDLGPNRIIQNKSRFKIPSEEKLPFLEKSVGCFGGDATCSDRSEDTIRKKEELPDNNDLRDSELFSAQSEKLFPADSLISLNSDTSYREDVHRSRKVHGIIHNAVPKRCSLAVDNIKRDDAPFETHFYFEFRNNLKSDQTSSLSDVFEAESEKINECCENDSNQLSGSSQFSVCSDLSQQSGSSTMSNDINSSKNICCSEVSNKFGCESPIKDDTALGRNWSEISRNSKSTKKNEILNSNNWSSLSDIGRGRPATKKKGCDPSSLYARNSMTINPLHCQSARKESIKSARLRNLSRTVFSDTSPKNCYEEYQMKF